MKRSIRLREWEPTTLELEASELAELRAVPADLTIEPGGAVGEYRVRPASIVGAVATSTLDIAIQPKVSIPRLLYLLGFAARAPELKDAVPAEREETVVEAFARIFVATLGSALRRGPMMGYRAREEADLTIRGRVLFADQARRRRGLPLPVELRYDDFTIDIEENRLLKAALRKVGRMHLRDEELYARIAEALTSFEAVEDVRYTSSRLPQPRLTRLNAPFATALNLARVILKDAALEHRHGSADLAGVLFDMNVVFEDYVFGALRDELKRSGVHDAWRQGARGALDRNGRIVLKPDLSLWKHGRCIFVGDAKYKRTGQGENADLYQLVAYCLGYDLPTGLLIYAEGPRGPVSHRVVNEGPDLHVRTLDLGVSISELRELIRQIAEEITLFALRSERSASATVPA